MSHFPKGVIFNTNNKGTSDSKYFQSFLPEFNVNSEKHLAKKQKLNPSENTRSTLTVNKSNDSNSKDCPVVGRDIKNEISVNRPFSKQSSSNCDLSSSNLSSYSEGLNKYKKETDQSKCNSYLDEDEENESWFQDCVGAVVAKCTQVEAEVDNEILQKRTQHNSKGEQNCGSASSYNSSKLLQPSPNFKPQSLKNGFYISNQKSNKVTPLRRSASGSDWPSSYSTSQYDQQKFLVFNSRSETKSVENSTFDETNSNLNDSKVEIERLKNELKAYKEKLQSKEGEVRMLRTERDQTKTEMQKQKQEVLKNNEIIQMEMNKKIRCYEKNIHTLKSQLQFEKMEVVIAQSQQTHSVESPRCVKSNGNFPNKWAFSSKKINKEKETGTEQKEVMLMQGDPFEVCDSVQTCQLLLELLTPKFFHKSYPETLALDPPKCSPNSIVKIPLNKKRKNSRSHPSSIDKAGVSLFGACLSLESCYHPLMELTKMVDLSNNKAREILLKILLESLKILEELLLRLKSSTLQEHFMNREKEICKNWKAYVPLNRDYDLLDFRPWYEEEKGIEARRCLGLLSILIQLSRFAICAILPAVGSNYSTYQDKENKFEDDKEDDNKQLERTNMILFVVEKIVEEIRNQSRTLVFEGVLTGIMQLILSIIKNELDLSKDSQQILLEIMKKVIFTRPGSTVMLKVFQFLSEAIRYPFITNELCSQTDRNTCVEDCWEITFTSDSCIIQMLCILALQLPEDFRYKLTDVFVSWVNSLYCVIENPPSWLYVYHRSTRCTCRALISQLTLTLLYEVCKKYEGGDIKDKKILEKVLPTGVFLVQNFVRHEENFPGYFGEYKGQFDLFLRAMNNFKNQVYFDPVVCNLLDKMTGEEEARDFSTSVVETEELIDLLSSI